MSSGVGEHAVDVRRRVVLQEFLHRFERHPVFPARCVPGNHRGEERVRLGRRQRGRRAFRSDHWQVVDGTAGIALYTIRSKEAGDAGEHIGTVQARRVCRSLHQHG